MDRAEAQAERARLQKLLDAYEASRTTSSVVPDRAGNVRARIARLDQFIAEIGDG